MKRTSYAVCGVVLLLSLVGFIAVSLASPPIHTCSACGRSMSETRRSQNAPGDWLAVEYKCDCGRRGALVVPPGGQPQWSDSP